jgi:hypothetical protein
MSKIETYGFDESRKINNDDGGLTEDALGAIVASAFILIGGIIAILL